MTSVAQENGEWIEREAMNSHSGTVNAQRKWLFSFSFSPLHGAGKRDCSSADKIGVCRDAHVFFFFFLRQII